VTPLPDSSPPLREHESLQQPVRLSVPASPRFLAAARVVAASLGVEAGLSVDDLDDLRLGVNELVSLMIEAATPEARVDLEFEVDGDGITVRGALDGDIHAVMEIDELTRRIVDAVVDAHQLDGASFSLTKGSSLRDV
jgi:anti-sigma regulatory factor (Ser/Thr protein kinase)